MRVCSFRVMIMENSLSDFCIPRKETFANFFNFSESFMTIFVASSLVPGALPTERTAGVRGGLFSEGVTGHPLSRREMCPLPKRSA